MIKLIKKQQAEKNKSMIKAYQSVQPVEMEETQPKKRRYQKIKKTFDESSSRSNKYNLFSLHFLGLDPSKRK